MRAEGSSGVTADTSPRTRGGPGSGDEGDFVICLHNGLTDSVTVSP